MTSDEMNERNTRLMRQAIEVHAKLADIEEDLIIKRHMFAHYVYKAQ